VQRRVAILIVDGFADSGLSIALDVLRAANAIIRRKGATGSFHIEVVSAQGGPVHAASGMVLQNTRSVARLKADIIMVPGIWAEHPGELQGVLARADTRRLVRAIAVAHARGALIASSCAGAFLLADAALLDGQQATTSWWLAAELQQRRPRVKVVPDAALIVGRHVVTGGAVFAQADVALHIVGRFAGLAVARRCAKLLLLDTHASQAPYMAAQHLRSDDPVVEKAERWIRAHLADTFDIAELARHTGVSPRTLARRLHAAVGLSPIAFVQHMRVQAAVFLLETSALSLAEIGQRVGYADPSTLSRLIRRETRTSAQALRRHSRAIGR